MKLLNFLRTIFFCVLVGICANKAQAQDFEFKELKKTGVLLAQNEGDDAYDPFSDYSEFDEASDEEADINFFRNGRFFVLGFAAGPRFFTDNMAKLYDSSATYGLFMSFFFDLRFALQAGFFTGDYGYTFSTPNGKSTGNVSLTFLDISLKYYVNTQNVTRGLADLNPYYVGGISQIYRTKTTPPNDAARDAVMGLHFGAGIEIPLMRKKAFFGVQGLYRYFTFKGESENLPDPTTTLPTSTKESGDSYDLVGTLGLNF